MQRTVISSRMFTCILCNIKSTAFTLTVLHLVFLSLFHPWQLFILYHPLAFPFGTHVLMVFETASVVERFYIMHKSCGQGWVYVQKSIVNKDNYNWKIDNLIARYSHQRKKPNYFCLTNYVALWELIALFEACSVNLFHIVEQQSHDPGALSGVTWPLHIPDLTLVTGWLWGWR